MVDVCGGRGLFARCIPCLTSGASTVMPGAQACATRMRRFTSIATGADDSVQRLRTLRLTGGRGARRERHALIAPVIKSRPPMRSLTAEKTDNLTDTGVQSRTILESEGARSNCSGLLRTLVDGCPAVFKTVCGALLRRPGWVRFPSIPARLCSDDSHNLAVAFPASAALGSVLH